MTKDLAPIRHTLAHLLASAVRERFPGARPTIGPAIDDGFYYDFDFSGGKTPSEQDLSALEQVMRAHLKKWTAFTHKVVSPAEAREHFKDNPYKLELIDELAAKGETITFYTCGDFTDLCRGGHAENPAKEIDSQSFKLTRVAGAYWHGDEKNKMLTRIYGFAFATKADLEKHLAMLEEAKKRDHRKLGADLDLFLTSELVGAGLPLWTPKGTMVRTLLDAYVWELRQKYGFVKVTIPHFTKKDLYEKSGHWSKFADELFRIKTREGHEYAVKPMNCPHHAQIFNRRPHSYREMPQRFAETTMVYRDEQSGELGGLTRVLSITQDDSHVFCRMNQVRDEYFKIWDIVDTFYMTFGFKLKVRLSFHDPKTPEKYLGTPEIWKTAEDALREIAKKRKADFFEAQGEAAMYGPKLDFMATDSMGRQHQVATIQLDMNQPERFDLTCTNEKGEKERIVMIHCAIMGSIERFSAVLLEHLGGNFPTWLAPVQAVVVPITDAHDAYARKVFAALLKAGIRAEYSSPSDSLGKRIRAVKMQKVPYMLVIGDKEKKAKKVTLESREKKVGLRAVDAVIKRISKEVATRTDTV